MNSEERKLRSPEERAADNLRQKLRRIGQMFVLPVDTIVGDAFWDCQKTTVIIHRQTTHDPVFGANSRVLGIRNRIRVGSDRGWKIVACYEVGKVYPVFKTRISAAYNQNASTPPAYAKVVSIYELDTGWEINIERHFPT